MNVLKLYFLQRGTCSITVVSAGGGSPMHAAEHACRLLLDRAYDGVYVWVDDDRLESEHMRQEVEAYARTNCMVLFWSDPFFESFILCLLKDRDCSSMHLRAAKADFSRRISEDRKTQRGSYETLLPRERLEELRELYRSRPDAHAHLRLLDDLISIFSR